MAVANDVAGYMGVDPGLVLDSFRRAVAERREKTIEAPQEAAAADEKGSAERACCNAELAGGDCSRN